MQEFSGAGTTPHLNWREDRATQEATMRNQNLTPEARRVQEEEALRGKIIEACQWNSIPWEVANAVAFRVVGPRP